MAGQLRGRWVRSLVSEDPITLRPAKLREVRWPDLAVRFAFGAAGAGVPGFLRTHRQALGAHAVALAAGPAGPLVTSFTEVAPLA